MKVVIAALTDSPTDEVRQNSAGAAMYLACDLNHLHTCLFDDKRNRRMVNYLSLVVNLVAFNSSLDFSMKNSSVSSNEGGGTLEHTGTL